MNPKPSDFRWRFSVILTIDAPPGVPLRRWTPTWIRGLGGARVWQMTEGDEWAVEGGWRHRKWVAVLSQEQFDKFVHEFWLEARDVEVGGSIGAPGFGLLSRVPAICFENRPLDDDEPYVTAYVTPVPEAPPEGVEGKLDWEAVRHYFIEKYRKL